MASKLTAEQQRRVDEILQFQRTVEHVAKLVAELEGNRAAKSSFIDNLCETIARELSQMRQRALTANIGTLGDVAGAMSGMAGRGGGVAPLAIARCASASASSCRTLSSPTS